MFFRLLFVLSLLLIIEKSKAQEQDTILVNQDLDHLHSPHKATIMSLVLPGLGQIYNRKYWKVPIIYAGLAGTLYFAFEERKLFREFKDAYIKRVDKDPTTMDLKYANYSNQNMLSLIDYHRRNRDLFFIFSGVVYALNIVDAAVDAHLFYFDVSDDLSASLRPHLEYDAFNRGFSPALKIELTIGKCPLTSLYYH